MRVALITQATVVNVVTISEEEYVAIAIHYENAIDVSAVYPEPQIGWTMVNGQLLSPSGTPTVDSVRITKLALRNRFTFNEKLALRTAMASSVALQAWYDDFQVATFIDLKRPDAIAGITFLETAGLLAAGRASQILTTPPTEEEKYRG